jgi:trehalose 6-phosphate synthase/phosphatase
VTLEKWLGKLAVSLVAEHGAWIRERDGDWRVIEPLRNDWKEVIKPIFELYTDRTPGSLLEEKDFSLVWHFRRADPELAYARIQELRDAILSLTANMGVGVFEGSKILEVKNMGVGKGRIAKQWLEKRKNSFILAAGDDYTDEDLFSVLPEKAFSIKIGYGISKARFSLGSVNELRLLLEKLVK